MKKAMMMIGLAAMMCGTSGCFTFCNCSGFGHRTMRDSSALALDVVTAPVQVAAVVGFVVVGLPAMAIWEDMVCPVGKKTVHFFAPSLWRTPAEQVALNREILRKNYALMFEEEGWLDTRKGISSKLSAVREEVESPDRIPFALLVMLAYRTAEDPILMSELCLLWKNDRFDEAFRCEIVERDDGRYNLTMGAFYWMLDHPNVSDQKLQVYEKSKLHGGKLAEVAREILRRRRKKVN